MYLLQQLPAATLKTQMGNGLVLMVLGMGIVFVFLTILVFTTKAVSAVVRKLESKKPEQTVSKPEDSAPKSCDAQIAAAIVAAVVKAKN